MPILIGEREVQQGTRAGTTEGSHQGAVATEGVVPEVEAEKGNIGTSTTVDRMIAGTMMKGRNGPKKVYVVEGINGKTVTIDPRTDTRSERAKDRRAMKALMLVDYGHRAWIITSKGNTDKRESMHENSDAKGRGPESVMRRWLMTRGTKKGEREKRGRQLYRDKSWLLLPSLALSSVFLIITF